MISIIIITVTIYIITTTTIIIATIIIIPFYTIQLKESDREKFFEIIRSHPSIGTVRMINRWIDG